MDEMRRQKNSCEVQLNFEQRCSVPLRIDFSSHPSLINKMFCYNSTDNYQNHNLVWAQENNTADIAQIFTTRIYSQHKTAMATFPSMCRVAEVKSDER